MRSTSAFVVVFLALCFLDLCQSAARSKRTKTRGKDRAHCQLTSDPGSCTSKLRRWFYDSTTEDCKTFTWTGCDGNDNRFRSRGQCERSCKGGVSAGGQSEDDVNVDKMKSTPVAKCRRLPCKGLRCHHGYEYGLDDNGCQTCQCMSLEMMTTTALPLVEVCPQVDCLGKFCPKGMQTDDRGCLTCQCLGCPPLNCPSHLNCHDGYVVDEQTGCELCACREDTIAAPHSDGFLCRPVECNISCRGDYGKDENGCEICSCAEEDENEADRKKKNCPKTECAPQCVLKVGKTGCPVCECKDDDDVVECDRTALVTCSMYCPGGYDRDSRGCEICDCRPLADEKSPDVVTGHVTCHPFNAVLCAEKCEHFYLRYDESGCEMCECVGDKPPEFTTPSLGYECPELLECTLECPEELERDERGCEICMCRKAEVDERLPETRNASPEVTRHACPAIQCPIPCPGGYHVDEETGCLTCTCVDDRPGGGEIVVTSDPFVTRDYELVYEEETETQEPNPTPYATWSHAMPEAPTTLAAPVTDSADPPAERSGPTVAAYPAEVMCTGRSCNKNCINGLRRSEGEECFICECNPETRSANKRMVDVSVFNARKGICSLPVYKGPCHATLTRWNFNSETGTCETFEYGGCRGYANNFPSKESCVEFCLSEVNQERAKRQERFKEVLGF